jgi:hypothetical protein
MLVEARISVENDSAARTFGEPTNDTHQPEGRLDSPSTIPSPLDEFDVGGSEFSWSSVESGPSPSVLLGGNACAAEMSSVQAAAEETMPLDTPAVAELSMQRHSLYFWDSITLKVSQQLGRENFLTDTT